MHDLRLNSIKEWLTTILTKQSWTITPLAGDASFRRYFRVQLPDQSLILMDAPPPQENIRPFIAIAQAFAQLNIQVPQIIAAEVEQGFLLLSDLGDDLYLDLLKPDTAGPMYSAALETLQRIQHCRDIADWPLPQFDEKLLLREWNLFQEWVLKTHWQVQLSTAEERTLSKAFEFLAKEFLAQPKTCVHRDYQSRNLMWLKHQAVGVLDFQDAVWGPVTYDALSLLRDCYIDWPQQQVYQWVTECFERTRENKLIDGASRDQFQRWFDLATAQRHLKNLGIFTRLKHSYGKPNYLAHLPRTLNYIVQVSDNYPELKDLREFLLQQNSM
jgi:aminoglycoside/choline kinase family phosphotransferase